MFAVPIRMNLMMFPVIGMMKEKKSMMKKDMKMKVAIIMEGVWEVIRDEAAKAGTMNKVVDAREWDLEADLENVINRVIADRTIWDSGVEMIRVVRTREEVENMVEDGRDKEEDGKTRDKALHAIGMLETVMQVVVVPVKAKVGMIQVVTGVAVLMEIIVEDVAADQLEEDLWIVEMKVLLLEEPNHAILMAAAAGIPPADPQIRVRATQAVMVDDQIHQVVQEMVTLEDPGVVATLMRAVDHQFVPHQKEVVPEDHPEQVHVSLLQDLGVEVQLVVQKEKVQQGKSLRLDVVVKDLNRAFISLFNRESPFLFLHLN
jgi:hypothetical protein